MAVGKYSRADGRKSSSCCSTVTVVILVGAALVAAWVMMSSSAVVPNSELSSQEPKTETISKVLEKISRQFEDSSGDLPEETVKDSKSSQDESNSEGKAESEDESKSEAENESNSGGEVSGSGDKDSNSNGEESNSEERNLNSDSGETNATEQPESEDGSSETKSNSEEETKQEDQEKVEENQEESVIEEKKEEEASNVGFPAGAQSEILNETTTQSGAWSTQAAESESEKESQTSSLSKEKTNRKWKLCNVTAGPDYIPCLDNLLAISKLKHRHHYQHRERHCPDEGVTCLVPLPEGYRQPVRWPRSRDQIWYYNVPHTKLADVKGHQNWVKVDGDHLTFPGGGTQFKNGALHYIDFIQKSLPDIAWGKRSRVILDVGCGVASFGGYLFERDVLAMSLAPKDEHEAQVQFALERGIPAISAVMGTKRLPYPSKVFDIVHCARCRVPWHIEGGKLLLELNRVLRPGGYFVWSATPVYQNLPEDVGIWKAMTKLTKSMCWELVTVKNDKLNQVGAAIFRKPNSNECYEKRPTNEPPLCEESDDPDAVWNVELQACMHKVPEGASQRGKQWPEQWPLRLKRPPYWLKSSQVGVYGKSAPEDFTSDYEHWKRVVSSSYLNGMGINWSSVRNVMDMRAVYGGFAAALKDLKLWVMNVVPINSPDTLPIIYERGLFGIYHDWCESFSTYPRSYDLLHADHLLSDLKKRCKLEAVIAEVDRILRPEGKFIVRDNAETVSEVENLAKSLKWKIKFTYTKDNEGLIYVEKTLWRPTEAETLPFATE
ncbi:hypothetical protein LguiB_010010 [Lonicera macranthoides]